MSIYPNLPATDPAGLNKKDFASDQEVRWCPGCGDYSILANVQKLLPTLGIPKENHVFISGIGCSSRFPYYMETYGMHGIHGRAAAIASGVKIANPDLSVWVITGDGDSLAIGGNHTIHVVRRNVDLNILMFNNKIYGLTKGQYSPTSEQGKRTKSSPMGSLDYPFNPVSLTLGAHARFVARVVDSDGKNMQKVLARAAAHKGTSFVEITQNCPIFNDGAWEDIKDRKLAAENQLQLEHGKPMLFAKGAKGIGIDKNMNARVVDVEAEGLDSVLVHDETNIAMAFMLSQMEGEGVPTPLGIFYCVDMPSYDQLVTEQIDLAISKKPNGTVQSLLESGRTWIVE